MTTALTTITTATVEQVLLGGDLAKLTPQQRVSYYGAVCESLGLNPLTRPFDYLHLSGKLVLYARKDCAEQLRAKRGISVIDVKTEQSEGIYVVTVTVQDKDGRSDVDMGAVSIARLTGEPLANAMLKALTKAKRRATLSICGLGMLDETEIASVPDARPVAVDTTTGEILDATPKPPPEKPAHDPFSGFGKDAFDQNHHQPGAPPEVLRMGVRADGAVQINQIVEKTSAKGQAYWVLYWDPDKRGSTWDKAIAEAAIAAREAGAWVWLEVEAKQRGERTYLNVIGLSLADAAAEAPTADAPPTNGSDLPF